MLCAFVRSAYVIYLYRKLNAEAEQPVATGTVQPTTLNAALDTVDQRLAALEARLTGFHDKVPARCDQATASAENAKTELDLAQSELDRQTQLFNKQVVAQAVLNKASAKVTLRSRPRGCAGSSRARAARPPVQHR
jgi:multidrug resistance efflux pump